MAETEGLRLANYDCDIWALLIHSRHHEIAAAFFELEHFLTNIDISAPKKWLT